MPGPCTYALFFFYSYAEMVVTSEESLKVLLEKIPQCKLNGDRMDCRFATRQNLNVFEEIANKRKSTTILKIIELKGLIHPKYKVTRFLLTFMSSQVGKSFGVLRTFSVLQLGPR